MSIFNHYAKQHPESVAFVFRKYGIKAYPTPRNIALAITAGKNTDFLRDLQNAVIKKELGHSNFEDDFDYFLVGMDEESFDGETVGITDAFEIENFIGNPTRKLKRKQKRIVRKNKRLERRTPKPNQRAVAGATNAELITGEADVNSTADKVSTAMGVVSNLASAAGGIAAQFTKSKTDTGGADGAEMQANDTEDPTTKEQGIKKYLPYILGGIVLAALIGGLVYFLKKKK